MFSLITSLFAPFLLLPFTLSCPPHDYHAILRRAESGEEAKTEFDYIASEDWGFLVPGAQTCFTGSQQAPIGLRTDQGISTTHIPDFTHFNQNITGLIGNGGHGITMTFQHPERDFTTLPNFTFDNQTVYCTGWHIHTPSDHTLDGSRAKAEIHFVMVNQEGTVQAVLGLLIQLGSQESMFISDLKEEEGGGLVNVNEIERTVEKTINLSLVLEEVDRVREFWTYQGSLTTPPCTEGLRFFVARQPLFASTAQIQTLYANGRFSGRVTQDIWNQRVNV